MLENSPSLTHTIENENKVVYKLWRIICYLPCAWLVILAIFTLGVTIQVGHFPSYGRPDPEHTGWLSPLYVLIIWGMPWPLVTIPVWGLLGVAIQWLTSYRFRWQDVVLYLIGILIYFGVVFTDFAGLFIWIAN